MPEDQIITVTAPITAVLVGCLRSKASEEHHPSRDADAMDAHIADCRDKIIHLRRIREELEDLLSGSLP